MRNHRKNKPFYDPNRLSDNDKWKMRIIKFFGFIFILLSILSSFEASQITNMFHGTIFFLPLFIVGVICGFGINSIINIRYPRFIYKENKYKSLNKFYWGYIILPAFGIPAIAGYYNRTHQLSSPECKVYKVLDKRPGFKHARYITVQINNTNEELKVPSDLYVLIDDESYVEFCIAKGGLGFDFVEDISIARK